LVDSAAGLTTAGYTADSWALATSAVTAARTVLANPAASLAEVQKATSDLAKALAGLIVVPLESDSVAVTAVKAGQKSLVLVKGQKLRLAANAYTAQGATVSVTWKSSKSSVATVNSKGTVTAKKAGKSVLTVSAGGKKATVNVTVLAKKSNAKVTSVTANVPKTLAVGAAASVSATYKSAKVAKVKVAYKSSAPGVAAIDSAGRLVAKAPGTAKITVKAGTKSKAYTVTVV
jgi:uncharacterized protein YjdB